QEEDTYLTANRSEFIGRRIIEWLAKGDTVSMLDIMQRHSGVSFGLGDILNESDAIHIVHIASLPQGTRDPSVYYKASIKGT
ncbi:hypothetical protein F5J12DRAFT_728310, partial [Pisolithus orientalis]|uniref:uncharacterized protein n=1 Tax=Pisolithus orientalis TaxID=936130 RepID=UPI002224BAD7